MALLDSDLRALAGYIQNFHLEASAGQSFHLEASAGQSFHFEASAGQSQDRLLGNDMLSRVESRRFSWSGDETNTHGMETGLSRRDRNLQRANLHFPFHVESETVTESNGSAVQSTKVLRRAHPAN